MPGREEPNNFFLNKSEKNLKDDFLCSIESVRIFAPKPTIRHFIRLRVLLVGQNLPISAKTQRPSDESISSHFFDVLYRYFLSLSLSHSFLSLSFLLSPFPFPVTFSLATTFSIFVYPSFYQFLSPAYFSLISIIN